MRLFVIGILLATGLAGCADLGTPESPFEETCPTWLPGRNTMDVTQAFSDKFNTTTREDLIASGDLSFNGHPLDRVEMNFHWATVNNQTVVRGIEAINSTMSVSFFGEDGRHLKGFRLGESRDDAVHTMTFGAYESNFTVLIDLVEVGAPSEPQPVIVRWTWDEDGDPLSKSGAVARYQAIPWFRRC